MADYRETDQHQLLLYDGTGASVFVRLGEGLPFLEEAIERRLRGQGIFDRVSILQDSQLLYDLTGQPLILPPERGAARRSREADTQLDEVRQRYGIRRLGIFGSARYDRLRPEGDLDLLVEFEPGHSVGYITFAKLEVELSEIFGRKVDLATPAALNRSIRDDVLDEALWL